jgi:hypothetical protein
MITQKPTPNDPLFLALPRKLVLLVLLMITIPIGLVGLLLRARISIPVLAFMITDAIMGLVAGFSVRWIIPRKAPVLRVCSILAFLTGSLALLGWFTGWGFGIDLFKSVRTGSDWWKLGQIPLATVFALLALFVWHHPTRNAHPVTHMNPPRKMLHTRRRLQKQPYRAPGPAPAAPVPNLILQPVSLPVISQSVKPKRKHVDHSKPKLLLSGQEEHRCPYCLELIDPDDRRGIVECKICHTLHHADCWAITGACQVPHFTA